MDTGLAGGVKVMISRNKQFYLSTLKLIISLASDPDIGPKTFTHDLGEKAADGADSHGHGKPRQGLIVRTYPAAMETLRKPPMSTLDYTDIFLKCEVCAVV